MFRADAPFLCFQGRCCPFFVCSGGLWLLVLFLVVLLGSGLLVINSYLSKKKKKSSKKARFESRRKEDQDFIQYANSSSRRIQLYLEGFLDQIVWLSC